METSTIAILAVVAFLIISITCTAIKHFRAKNSGSNQLDDLTDLGWHPGDALLDFEPIKSHYEEYVKARDTKKALKRAILRNLIDNDYPYADRAQSIPYLHSLPDLLELQNIIKLKPIIKEIEDQYKRYEEARSDANTKKKFIENLVQRVLDKLKKDQETQELALSRDVYKSKHPKMALYELLSSTEAKVIVERCINDVIKDSNNDLTVGNNNGQEEKNA